MVGFPSPPLYLLYFRGGRVLFALFSDRSQSDIPLCVIYEADDLL